MTDESRHKIGGQIPVKFTGVAKLSANKGQSESLGSDSLRNLRETEYISSNHCTGMIGVRSLLLYVVVRTLSINHKCLLISWLPGTGRYTLLYFSTSNSVPLKYSNRSCRFVKGLS
jgi:hypothetical protein